MLDTTLFADDVGELLDLLFDPDVLRELGWPSSGPDFVMQSILTHCGSQPFNDPKLDFAQRLLANTKLLFSFIIDDQQVLDDLLAEKSMDQILRHVIELSKCSSADEQSNGVAQ